MADPHRSLSPTSQKSFASLFKDAQPSASDQTLLPPSSHRGEPALKISQSLVDPLSKPFHFALIGKFSHGRATMERSRQVFSKLGLTGSFSLGHLDPKHMLIRLQDDFNRIWLKDIWFIDGFSMQIFRWSLEFRSDVESFIAPSGSPSQILHCFSLINSVYFNWKINWNAPDTRYCSRWAFTSSVARLCNEVDRLKRLPSRI